jgi:hypothetical protein
VLKRRALDGQHPHSPEEIGDELWRELGDGDVRKAAYRGG